MKHLLLFLLIVNFVSCGKSSRGQSAALETRITEEQIQSVLSNQKLECSPLSGATCPDGMVRILYLNKENADESRVCSGFMISSNRMITNNHCIATQAECDSTYLVLYETVAGRARLQRSRCSKLIDTLDDSLPANNPNKRLDVSVIEISSIFRGRPFVPSQNKLENGEETVAWVIDHSGLNDPMGANLFNARITEFRCVHDASAPFRSLIFNKCPVIGGNSGSPMLNMNGEVIGVIWGASQIDYDARMSHLFIRRLLKDAIALVTEISLFQHFFD